MDIIYLQHLSVDTVIGVWEWERRIRQILILDLELGLPERTDNDWLVGLGTPLRVQFGPWGDDPIRMDALVATYREYNLRNHDARVTAYPGAVAMVEALRARGLKTGLVTSKAPGGTILTATVGNASATRDILVRLKDNAACVLPPAPTTGGWRPAA